jgi:hypothetical protein
MIRRAYLVLLLLLLAAVATGVYFRQRTLRQAANCETPAPQPPQATPPPKLPGFAVEASCGTGTEAPPRPGSGQAKAAEKKK